MIRNVPNPKEAIGSRKVPLSTVSAPVLAELGLAMLEGAVKYGRHNYRVIGVRASTYYDSTMRHLMQWWEGEDIDADSGLSHVTKAITSLVILRDAMIQDKLTDDRPPSSGDWLPELNAATARLLDKHPSPKAAFVKEGKKTNELAPGRNATRVTGHQHARGSRGLRGTQSDAARKGRHQHSVHR